MSPLILQFPCKDQEPGLFAVGMTAVILDAREIGLW